MTDNHAADIPAMGPVTEAPFQMTLPVFSQLLEPVGIAPVSYTHLTLPTR